MYCKQFYVETPLIESFSLATTLKTDKVYLKLENTQPSGSFKLRGLSNLINKEIERGKKRFVIASGGNAGLAAAYVTKRLGIPLDIYVPGSTGSLLIEKIKQEGANVVVHGSVWDESDAKARKECLNDQNIGYLPPFDHPDVWDGNAKMIAEIATQLKETPDLVVLSVGGGGLLLGICRGMEEAGWNKVPILALETEGADSFHQSDLADCLVTLPNITSIATTLGALTIAGEVMNVRKKRTIISRVVTDRDAVSAISRFLDDHRFLVEPSCGASLAAFYSGLILRMQEKGQLPDHFKSVVVIVCGGAGVNYELLTNWKTKFDIV